MGFIALFCVFYIAMFLVMILHPTSKKTTAEENEIIEVKQPAPPHSVSSSTDPSVFEHLKEIGSLVEAGGYEGEVRKIARALRLTMGLRKKLNASVVSSFLNYALTTPAGSELHTQLAAYLMPLILLNEDEADMEVDTTKQPVPDLEIYCYLLVLIHLIDQRKYDEAKACSLASIARLKTLNLKTVDVIASKIYYYYSLTYERTGHLSDIRGNLLTLHRIATHRRDELGQEMLLNLLLRNYLHYNLYDQAEKFRSKAPCFEAKSNHQFCRHLFYLGKIRTIQLEYTDAKEYLYQAAQKAPVSALGFLVQCNKWGIMVHLLLGEIPKRTVFMQKGMDKALRAYFELTNAVRIGDFELFKTVSVKFSSTFSEDGTKNLIARLRHNVIRTGLRNISISYSRISLVDVAKKLCLDFENPIVDVGSIIAKAVRDGTIDATLDHANGIMICKGKGDVYSTNEPHIAFNSRISFCLN
ncbi:unnamed protein product, partial [Cuscuta epithymum]